MRGVGWTSSMPNKSKGPGSVMVLVACLDHLSAHLGIVVCRGYSVIHGGIQEAMR